MQTQQSLDFLGSLRFVKSSFLGGSEVQEIARALKHIVLARGTILDVGVGDGEFLSKVILAAGGDPAKYRLVGVDPDEESLSHARLALPAGNFINSALDVFVAASAGEASFDAVLSVHSLYYMPNLRESLYQMGTLLTEDGVFVASLWSETCSVRALACAVAPNVRNLRSAEQVRDILRSLSFDVQLHVWEGQVNFGAWRSRSGLEAASLFLSRAIEPDGVRRQDDLKTYLGRVEGDIAPRRNGVLVARRRVG